MTEKKINTKRLGDKFERECLAILQAKGYNVIKSPRTMKRIWLPGGRTIFVSQANDFFGCFDLICKEDIGKTTTWIQVKGDPSDVSKAKLPIIDFYNQWCSHTESVQIWLRIPKKGFIIYSWNGSDWPRSYINLKGENCEQFNISESKSNQAD